MYKCTRNPNHLETEPEDRSEKQNRQDEYSGNIHETAHRPTDESNSNGSDEYSGTTTSRKPSSGSKSPKPSKHEIEYFLQAGRIT